MGFADQGMAGDASPTDRVTITVSRRVLDPLDAAAQADGLDRPEALQRMLSLGLFVRDEVMAGADILVARPGGPMERIVLPH